MKSLMAILAVTTALTIPTLANAAQVTLTTKMKNYGGNGAYLAYYITDANGRYVKSLWMAGGKSKYYDHMRGWYRATRGDRSQISGVTGASVGSGRTLKLSSEIADSLFDAGYKLHIDAAVEDMRDSPNDVVVPLTTSQSGKPVAGRYISDSTFTK